MHDTFLILRDARAVSTELVEIGKASAEFAASQRDDGFGSGKRPMHAGALQARADGELTACLDDTGGSAKQPLWQAAQWY